MKLATPHYLAPPLAILLLAVSLFTTTSDANLARILIRRQAEEREQESTTEKPTSIAPAASTESTNKDVSPQNPPARLYPDLPQAFVPPPPPPVHHPHISGPTPFVPFGIPAPTGRLNHVINEQHVPQMPPQPRPLTPADRLQSQTFANGLGRRLLAMIGVNLDNNDGNGNSNQTQSEQERSDQQKHSSPEMALRNATVLQQLNNGVHSVYEGLSKVYNSTIQQQMANLQEQLKKTANTTNPWMQNMSQETARFYKSLVARVERAQDNLNKLWQEATQANETTLNRSAEQQQPSPFERFFQNPFSRGPQPPHPVYPEMRVLNQDAATKQQGDDLAQKLIHFWSTQVRPQMAQVQNQVSSVWNDMFRSGAFTPDVAVQTRRVNSVSAAPPGNKSSGLIDDILKDVEMVNPEYKIEGEEAKSGDGDSSPETSASEEDKRKKEAPSMANDTKQGQTLLNSQMQTGLINAQRELNQLWMGLSNTLQSAVEKTKHMMEPQPTFGGMHNKNTAAPAEVDPAENEIDSKIRELGAAQRDADLVYNVVQQQQREAERKSFTDQLRNFWKENNVDQLPNRIGESFTKFGNTMSNFWNQVPERWDSFVQNVRPRVNSSSSTTTTTTTTTTTPGSV